MFNTVIEVDGQTQPAIVSLATAADVELLRSWTVRYGSSKNPKISDILEYMAQALKKQADYDQRNRCPEDWDDYADWIRDNPNGEVAGLFVLKAPSIRKAILGFIFIRRVWDNSLSLDFLGTHPGLSKSLVKNILIRGVGTALFVAACKIAAGINAHRVYGEATSASATFYMGVLKKAIGYTGTITSLFELSSVEYQQFISAAPQG